MPRPLRSAISALLAGFLLLSGFAAAPNTVLCFGPGHHCHLEALLGAACGMPQPTEPSRPLDRCPHGSKDFPLSLYAHHNDGRGVIAAPLCATLHAPEIAAISVRPASGARLPVMASPTRITVVLRR